MNPAVLADGLIDASPTVVYQVPRGKQMRIDQVHCFNPGAASQTVVMSTNTSGTNRQWAQALLLQYETVEFLESPLLLDENDAILLSSTDGSQVTYLVHGEPKV